MSLYFMMVSCQYYVYDYHNKTNITIEENNSLLFPEGINGDAIIFTNDTIFSVPEGFALYVLNFYNISDSDSKKEYYNSNNYLSEKIKDKIVIIPPEKNINTKGLFNGLLIQNSIKIINWDTDTNYYVPFTDDFYLTSFLAMGLIINDFEVESWPDDKGEIFSPLIIPAGTKLEHNGSYIFTGYLKPLPIETRRSVKTN
ncbi:MAG: hypothetical protein JXR22_06510 [Prolixibacteraceae bacterium]|nr:hypothetical protein [Prolixibacteraceae bacterium]